MAGKRRRRRSRGNISRTMVVGQQRLLTTRFLNERPHVPEEKKRDGEEANKPFCKALDESCHRTTEHSLDDAPVRRLNAALVSQPRRRLRLVLSPPHAEEARLTLEVIVVEDNAAREPGDHEDVVDCHDKRRVEAE